MTEHEQHLLYRYLDRCRQRDVLNREIGELKRQLRDSSVQDGLYVVDGEVVEVERDEDGITVEFKGKVQATVAKSEREEIW